MTHRHPHPPRSTRAMSALCTLTAALLTTIAIHALPACTTGYSFASSYDENIRTVAVPIWENTSFAHGLEFQLTEALIKEIHRTTPWKVINTPGQSDASLTGSIVSANLRKLSTQPDSGLVQELATEIVVAFEFKDATTGRVFVARRGFRAADSFVPSPGAGERIEQSQTGAVDRLARSIIAELRQAW